MDDLTGYYFNTNALFVVPIEHLSRRGMSAAFRSHLAERTALPVGWADLFDAAFAAYWGRTEALAAQAPRHWFPPRLQHCCVVTDVASVRPYFQPFNKCSWLVYASDFDPSVSNVEFGAFQLVQAERMGLLQEVTQTVVRNLGYWLLRTDEEITLFREACDRTPRPDAAAYRALAKALPWIRRLHHQSINPARVIAPGATMELPQTGIVMLRTQQPELDTLVQEWAHAARGAMEAFYRAHAGRASSQVGRLCDWLRDRRPDVVVTGERGRLIWEPQAADRLGALRALLRDVPAPAVASIHADLEIIHQRSRGFLDSLRHPDQLPAPHLQMAQQGLSYVDAQRRLIAYNVREPGMERLRVPAPPYERFMLAARTAHEWGHLAVDAGWVPVAPARVHEVAALREELASLFEEIHQEAPAAVRALAADDLTRLTRGGAAIGAALADIVLRRVPDFQANILARCYLTVEERETYIRNNVYTLALVSPAPALFRRLARYAYEFQYLRLSLIADPRTYFLHSTWFADEYLRRGVLSEERLDRLLGIVGRLCDWYAVDWEQFTPEFAAAQNRGDNPA